MSSDREASRESDAFLSLSFPISEMKGLDKMNSDPASTLFIVMSLYDVLDTWGNKKFFKRILSLTSQLLWELNQGKKKIHNVVLKAKSVRRTGQSGLQAPSCLENP